ncbi:cytidylyltransferase family-domain-containing protein [Schizothecium vesticola]|uniref:Phosphatidate cytidylyltransferase n=1 Tax=Schizothecium vesticola TaxID=314040 RepID=A0AA40EXG5_9PEZI|nr:cytidylyltransferase family-domain-containing protein [Schizothecium vesticola]
MSTKQRRGVKFNHKSKDGADGRRLSMSEVSEEGGRSPTRGRFMATLDGSFEVPPTPAEQKLAEYEKKKANFITRTFWTFVMIGGFFTALFLGHIYIILIITMVQVVSFKEVINIASVPSRARGVQNVKALNWYWLTTTMYFLYGESMLFYFKHIVLVGSVLTPLATHHRFISFTLYIFGFIFFVGTLKNGQLKFQFTQFAWTHIALVLIVFQGHFIIYNVFEGMFWFFLPAALVITNDIFAYICGITFGRTQLIKLSPKKTVEGFVGAWVMTVLFGIFLTHFLIKSPYFICPVNNLGATYFSGLQCQPNKVFIPQVYSSPHLLFLPDNWHFSFTMAPVQIHTFFWATFASLVAPFGGFFASGIKRTFKIKDFGDSIPGHGGITDRMDCQFIMGLFAYVYITSFIRYRETSPGAIMEEAIGGLSYDDQFELIGSMIKYLVAHKALGPQVRGKRRLLA